MRRILILPIILLIAAIFNPLVAQEEVSWQTLARVKYSQEGNNWVASFDASIQALNGKTVTVEGFMIPLDQSSVQRNFLLSAVPLADCQYCTPETAASMIEIQAVEGIEFGYDLIKITGSMELLKDDPMGMLYRISEAKQED